MSPHPDHKNGLHPSPSGAESAPGDVPDHYIVVRGGVAPLPPLGVVFSGAAGVDKVDAARGVPHGQIRVMIRANGGRVVRAPEVTREGTINDRHVNVVEGARSSFGDLEPNPVPKGERIR